jgi:hypothetical protein
MPPATVIGITAEDCKRFRIAVGKISVTAIEPAYEAVEVWGWCEQKKTASWLLTPRSLGGLSCSPELIQQ